MRHLVRFLLAFACAGDAVAFDGDGVRYVSPTGAANNAFGQALALQSDGGFHVAGIAYER